MSKALWDPMDYSLSGSPAHGTLQAKILEWGTTSYSDSNHRALLKTFFIFFKAHISLSTGRVMYLETFKALGWRRKWQPTPVFLPGKSHGQRCLVGYSPWGRRVRRDWMTKHTLGIVYPRAKFLSISGPVKLICFQNGETKDRLSHSEREKMKEEKRLLV